MSTLSYAAPPALSDIELDSKKTAAKTFASSNARRLARMLGSTAVTAVDALLAAVGGTTAGGATSDVLTSAAPRPTTASDLLPGRPLDSRVLSVRVSDASGELLPLAQGVFPVNVTVPFRDLSIVKWDALLKSATVDVGNSGFAQPTISVVCPSAPTDKILATYVRGGVGAAFVRLESSQATTFTGVVGSTTTSATGTALNDVAAPGGTSVASNLLELPTGTNTSVGAVLSAQAPTVSSVAYTFLLSFDCGPAFGRQTFACGAGFAGTQITFACPAVIAVPKCVRYNMSASGWSTAGCSVSSTSITSAVCSCDGPGDIAVRFAALSQLQSDVFAIDTMTTVTSTIGVWHGLFALLGAFVGLNILGILLSRDNAQRAAWASRMAADIELRDAARDAPFDVALARKRPDSPSARIVPISDAGLFDAPTRDVAMAALGSALTRLAGAAAVVDTPLTPQIEVWRAAMSTPSSPAPNRSMIRRIALAVVHARLFRGEPSALLVALSPLFRCFRARPLFDAYFANAAPASVRLLGALCAVTTSAAGTAVLYAYLLALNTKAGSPAFAPLSTMQLFALAFAVSIFVQTPIDAVILSILRWRARVAAQVRLPLLALEMARRVRADTVLGEFSTSTLLRLSDTDGHLSPSEIRALDDGTWWNGVDNVGASLLPTLRDALSARISVPSYPTALVIFSNVFLLAVNIFSCAYSAAFAYARGPEATVGAAIAWSISVVFMELLFRPVSIAVRVALAFQVGGSLCTRSTPKPLTLYHDVMTRSSVAAAVAGAGTMPVDAAAALVSPEAIAAALLVDGATSARAALRVAIFARAYLDLAKKRPLPETLRDALKHPRELDEEDDIAAPQNPPPRVAFVGVDGNDVLDGLANAIDTAVRPRPFRVAPAPAVRPPQPQPLDEPTSTQVDEGDVFAKARAAWKGRSAFEAPAPAAVIPPRMQLPPRPRLLSGPPAARPEGRSLVPLAPRQIVPTPRLIARPLSSSHGLSPLARGSPQNARGLNLTARPLAARPLAVIGARALAPPHPR